MKKQILTVEMLRQALEAHYSHNVVDLLLGAAMCVMGVLFFAGGIIGIVLGIGFLFFGIKTLRGYITNNVRRKARMEKIRQGKFYLGAQPVQRVEVHSDSDSSDTYWIYIGEQDGFLLRDEDYPITEVGDIVYCLYLEEEGKAAQVFLQKRYEPDARAAALIR